MNSVASGWLLPILGSAIGLGFYDLCKNHAVHDNSVMPVLFFATLSGTIFSLFGAVIPFGYSFPHLSCLSCPFLLN
jgi:hypothetical protein